MMIEGAGETMLQFYNTILSVIVIGFFFLSRRVQSNVPEDMVSQADSFKRINIYLKLRFVGVLLFPTS